MKSPSFFLFYSLFILSLSFLSFSSDQKEMAKSQGAENLGRLGVFSENYIFSSYLQKPDAQNPKRSIVMKLQHKDSKVFYAVKLVHPEYFDICELRLLREFSDCKQIVPGVLLNYSAQRVAVKMPFFFWGRPFLSH